MDSVDALLQLVSLTHVSGSMWVCANVHQGLPVGQLVLRVLHDWQ
jgi:hypothetical protein